MSISINRQVIESTIVADRRTKRSTQNVWNYVTHINKQLTNNKIYEDSSIIVSADFVVDDNIITQITEIYEGAGWVISNVTFTQPVGNEPGLTEITFTAPPEPAPTQ